LDNLKRKFGKDAAKLNENSSNQRNGKKAENDSSNVSLEHYGVFHKNKSEYLEKNEDEGKEIPISTKIFNALRSSTAAKGHFKGVCDILDEKQPKSRGFVQFEFDEDKNPFARKETLRFSKSHAKIWKNVKTNKRRNTKFEMGTKGLIFRRFTWGYVQKY
jgi:hypothetical protein